MTGASLASWNGFFTVSAGASATLVGLLFVSLSVNIREILKYHHLPTRAAATLGSLMLILVASLAFLAPQPRWAMALEVLAASLMAWIQHVRSAMRARAAQATYGRPVHEGWMELAMGQAMSAPFIVGAGLMLAGSNAALAILAAGVILAFALSVLNAWVLLVEILR
jgi:modulator of FtsH protease